MNARRSAVSRSALSRVAERLWDDYQAFATRSLAYLAILYPFIDGVAERLHLGQPREAVLAAWRIDASGTKHLLGLQPGTKEDMACMYRAVSYPSRARCYWLAWESRFWPMCAEGVARSSQPSYRVVVAERAERVPGRAQCETARLSTLGGQFNAAWSESAEPH